MNVRYGITGLFLLAMTLVFTALPADLSAEETVHIVQKDETIYAIARSFGISRDELMKYNGITDPSKLQAGQRLKIPGAPAVSGAGKPAAAAEYTQYRVLKNDTYYSIARQYGISLDTLLEANGRSRQSVLKVGETLRLPLPGGSSGLVASGTSGGGGAAPRGMAARPVDRSLRWPVAAREVNYLTGKLSGVALVGEKAESVKSLTQGTVVSAGPYRGFGRVAIVQVTGGYLYVYGGCESLTVKEGDRVGSGTELGKLGIDAVSEKPQLFFLVYRGNTPVDPATAPRT